MRALRSALLIAFALLLALGIALFWLPSPLARIGLRAAGIDWLAFEDLRFGLGSIELQGLEIGTAGDQQVDRLRLGYRLNDLLEGHLQSLEIEGLALKVRATSAGLELAGFEDGQRDDDAGLGLPLLPERFVLRDSHIDVATPFGEVILPLAAELRRAGDEVEFDLAIEAARLEAGPDALQADLGLRGTAPLDLATAAEEMRAEGTLDFAAKQLRLPGSARGIGTTGKMELQIADGRLMATTNAELTVQDLHPGLAELKDALPPPWQIRLGDDQRHLQLVGHLDPAALRLEIDGPLTVITSGPSVTIEIAAGATVDGGGRLTSLAPSRALVELNGLEWRQNILESGRIELVAGTRGDIIEGKIDIDLAGRGAASADLSLANMSLQQSLDFLLSDASLEVTAPDAGRLQIERITAPGGIRSGPLEIQLEPDTGPLLTAQFEDHAITGWQLATSASLTPFTTTVGDDALQILSSIDALSLELNGDGDGLSDGRIALADGRLELPQHAMTLSGITAEWPFGPDGPGAPSTVPIAIERIAHLATPPLFAPSRLQASLQPDVDHIEWQARLATVAGSLEIVVDGSHGWASEAGAAKVQVEPVTFAPEALQPADLAPVLGDVLADVAGRLALDGDVTWRPDEVSADLALLIEGGGFAIGPARVEAINGVIGFDRLWPPTTPPGQQLAVGLLDLGLPLTNGLVSFQLTRDERLAVEELRWQLAGGTVSAEPFSVGSGTLELDMTLHAAGLDLDQVFALTRLDGLSGEGRIAGVLPISLRGNEAVIDGGELAAEGPGIVHYKADQGPSALAAGGASVDLLLQALENFRYDALRITLDGRTDAAMDIGLHISGANPDLYDGHPIELNLDLEGELANILRSGLASYQIPDRIRERMQGFGP